MKSFFKNMSVICSLLLAMASFSSCEQDEIIGMRIEGHWFGDMDMYNAYTGERAEGSEIEFYTGWSLNHGRGVEVDYYYYARPVRNEFEWEVVNGVVYLRFLTDPGLDCRIFDYSLSSYSFSGYIDNYDGSSTFFELRNYDRDWNTYGYGNRYYGTRSAEETTDSVEVKGIRGCNMK